MLSHIIGVFGSLLIVLAYGLLEKGTLDRNSIRYYAINLSGAVFLTLSLIQNFNLGSFVIEIFWIGISIVGILRVLKERRFKRAISRL